MSQILRAELRKKGYSKTIKLAALAAGIVRQYGREDANIRPGIKQNGAYNSITVINTSTTVPLEIQLDFSPEKIIIIPASTTISTDEKTFQEFNVVNRHAATAIAVNEVTIVIAFEPPLLRDRTLPQGAR